MKTESRQVLMCRIVEEYSPMLLRLAYSRLDSAAAISTECACLGRDSTFADPI